MRPPLRALVVDDEPLARRTVAELLAADPEVELVGMAADARCALELAREHEPDLIFLDIQMPGSDGFDFLRELDQQAPPLVIFVTAYDEHAARAFEVAALDYLLKPFDDQRFRDALARAKAARHGAELAGLQEKLLQLARDWPGGPAARMPSGPAAGDSEADGIGLAGADGYYLRLLARVAGRIRLIDVDRIDWIEAADYCARLHAGAETTLIRASLSLLESRLDPRRFVRVHRSALVKLARVTELRRHGGGEWTLTLADGTPVRVSRGRRAALQERLGA